MTHQRKEMLSIHRHGHQGRNISSPFVECQLKRTNCIFSSEIPMKMWRFNNQFFFQDFEIALCYFYIFQKRFKESKTENVKQKLIFKRMWFWTRFISWIELQCSGWCMLFVQKDILCFLLHFNTNITVRKSLDLPKSLNVGGN